MVVSDGQVVEQGTHDELMALKSDYYSLVTTQVTTDELDVDAKGEYSRTYIHKLRTDSFSLCIERLQGTVDFDDRRDSITPNTIDVSIFLTYYMLKLTHLHVLGDK